MTVMMMVAFLADKCKSQASSFVPLPFITERKLFASREQLEAKIYINILVVFLTVVEALELLTRADAPELRNNRRRTNCERR